MLRGMTLTILPPRIQKIGVARNWGDTADFEELTKCLGSGWDSEFAPTAAKAVNEIKAEEESG